MAAPNDPISDVAAENFDYATGAVEAREGDTVFFRGRNGFFGAWTITLVEGDNKDAVLTGEWYFKAGGGGDFTSAVADGGTSNYDAGIDACDGY